MILRIAVFVLIFYYKGTISQSPKTETSCNGDLKINCTSKLIAISSATFGEVNDCISRASVTPLCSSSKAVDVVRTACQNKNYCKIKAVSVTFGTKCSGKMLLNVSYTCLSGLQGDRYLRPLAVTKSSVQLRWQKHSNEDNNTKYVIERRDVPASQPSAIAGLFFEGFGYVNFDDSPFNGGKNFLTKLTFRTSAPNGLLFVAFKSDWSSYAYLQLTNGTLKFVTSSTRGSVEVSTTATLDDGQFHTVEAQKRDKDKETLKLTVDGTETSSSVQGGGRIDVQVESVYVGGINSTQYVKDGVLSQTDGFIGCMNVNQLESGKTFDIKTSQSYENVRWSTNGCPPAVHAGMHFRGAGYAKLTLSPSSSSQLKVSFRMRTSWSNGLLLAAYSNGKGEFLFVESRVNGLDLRHRSGFGPSDGPFLVQVRPKTVSLCDGAWHTVSLAIDAAFLVVTVDGVAHNTSCNITNVQMYSSDIMENVYLGGIDSTPKIVQKALGYGVNVTSYGGCLADFKVNEQLVDYVKKRIASLNVSFAGCSDFTWEGPTCVDQVLRVGSEGEGEESLTDNDGVKAFTEYLYRLAVESGSGALVHTQWIVVRSGEDKSFKGPLPELEYDGSIGKGTFRWTGPPAIVKDFTSYEIYFAELYPGTAQPPSKSFSDIKDVPLPYIYDVAALTMYTFTITASLVSGSVTSSYSSVTTSGRECRRTLYRGTSYRGSAAVSADGKSCLNWSELSTYTNLLTLYPEAGLGNHSYCRNPISENRTMPWCYTEEIGGCLNWAYCDIDECEDMTCYSTVDNGYGYRGSTTDSDCVSWQKFNTFSVSQYAAAGLGDHSYCRNPDPLGKSKPWCYEDDEDTEDCSVSKCINDGLPSVTYVCGGNSGRKETECIFPFLYKGKRFFECTIFERSVPWCSTKNVNGEMNKWSYCLCPKPSISIPQPTYFPPANGRIDGTCLLLPTTVPSTVTTTNFTTTASTLSATTAIRTTASAASPSSTSEAAVSPTVQPTTSDATASTASPITSEAAVSTAVQPTTFPMSTFSSNQTTLPTSHPSSASSVSAKVSGGSSPMYIGIGVGMGLLFIAIVVVVAVFARRRGRRQSTDAYDLKEQAMEMDLRSSRIHSPSYAVVLPFENEGYEYRDSSVFQRSSGLPAEYCQPALTETTSTAAQIFQNPLFQDDGNYEVPVNLAQSQAVSGKTAINELKDDIYWEPAKTEERLYDQLSTGKFRVLERSSVQLEEILGTGQFGTVERGIWTDKDSKSPIVVAVKTLKSESEENKVKFLREAAIMGQFNHRNVVVMHGVVLTGRPLMVVLEILPKGDLKQFLQSIANEDTLPSDLPARLLQMSRDIAAGMEYLAKRCFVHRDLAARNVLLGEKLVCKIADFGLSRDLADDNYYVTKGGQIPFRWTAPEAINFRKYSTSSDVWSYGIVLYEIWTVGKRPYGNTKNRAVLDLLETGYRLPPPPGCSYAIYKLMIECWNPDHHKRPTFNAIATRLSPPDEMLLANDANAESIQGSAGDELEASQSAYRFLQEGYKVSCTYN